MQTTYSKLVTMPMSLKNDMERELLRNGLQYKANNGSISANELIVQALAFYLSSKSIHMDGQSPTPTPPLPATDEQPAPVAA